MSRIRTPLRRISRIGVSVLMAGLIGCSHRIPDYPEKPFASCPRQGGTLQVRLGADPITEANVSRTYFDMNLKDARQLAVCVVVENTSADTTLLVRREQFTIEGAAGRDDRGLRSTQRAGEAVAMTGAVGLAVAPVVALPVLLVGAGISSNAHNVRVNIENKSIQTRTLAPGERAQGFVFFQLPNKGTPAPAEWVLRFSPQSTRSAALEPVQVTLLQGAGYP